MKLKGLNYLVCFSFEMLLVLLFCGARIYGADPVIFASGYSLNSNPAQAATEAVTQVQGKLGTVNPGVIMVFEDIQLILNGDISGVLSSINAVYPGVPVFGRGDYWDRYDPYTDGQMSTTNGLSIMAVTGVNISTAYITDCHSSYSASSITARGKLLAENLLSNGIPSAGSNLCLVWGECHTQMGNFMTGMTSVLGSTFPFLGGSCNDWSPLIYEGGRAVNFGAQAVLLNFPSSYGIAWGLSPNSSPTGPQSAANAVRSAYNAIPPGGVPKGMMIFICASWPEGGVDVSSVSASIKSVVGNLPFAGEFSGGESGKASLNGNVENFTGAIVSAVVFQISSQTAPSAVLELQGISNDTISFGDIKAGETSNLNFTISNSGGGLLTGAITVDQGSSRWLSVSPASFSGDSTLVKVTADNTVSNSKNGTYSGIINILSNGGNKAVNVNFTATCVLVKPNPVRLSSPLVGEGKGEGCITFFGDGIVPGRTTIKIYTLSGSLLAVIPATEPESSPLSLRGALATWQSQNEITWTPSTLSPGIYVYTYESPKEKGVAKFTVTR